MAGIIVYMINIIIIIIIIMYVYIYAPIDLAGMLMACRDNRSAETAPGKETSTTEERERSRDFQTVPNRQPGAAHV